MGETVAVAQDSVGLISSFRDTHLHQLHDKVQFRRHIHLFNQKNDVGMLHSPEDGHLVLDHVLLPRAKAVLTDTPKRRRRYFRGAMTTLLHYEKAEGHAFW